MTYWRLALAVSLSAFAVAACLASMARVCIVPLMSARLDRLGARQRATVLLVLRVFPGAVALAVGFGLVLPTFLYFEPPDTREGLAATLLVLAGAGGVLLLRSVAAGIRAWRATRRIEREWAAEAAPVEGLDTALPVFAIRDTFPTVALVGVRRPRLYMARRVLEEFPAEELSAMLSHEAAHVTSRDNLKRLLMRAVPDVGLDAAVRVERAWAMAAEEAADALAVAGSHDRRLDLAQALVRVARLAPATPMASPVSAFYLGGSVESRVRLLLNPPDARPAPRAGVLLAAAIAAGAVIAFIAAAPSLHQLMEAVVRYLP